MVIKLSGMGISTGLLQLLLLVFYYFYSCCYDCYDFDVAIRKSNSRSGGGSIVTIAPYFIVDSELNKLLL